VSALTAVPSEPVGVIATTPLGEALTEVLRRGGREVVAAHQGAALAQLARACRLVVLDATPVTLRPLLDPLGELLDGGHLVVHTLRGLVAGQRPAELLEKMTAVRRIGVLGGPLRVAELEAGRPAVAVVAARHPEVVTEGAALLSTPLLRVYRSRDPVSVELAAGVAGVVAFGCGVVDGLGLGLSARLLVVTRGQRELERLLVVLGGDLRGASGVGCLGTLLARASDPEDLAYRAGLAEAARSDEQVDTRTRARLDLRSAERPSAPAAAPSSADVTLELGWTERLAEERALIEESATSLGAMAAERGVQSHLLRGLARLLRSEVGAEALVDQLMRLPVLDD
jgi:glycerol-3-phosphate dehydrogenase